MNFFSEDNFLHRFFLFAGGLIGLNLLWMITCIPVVTAGASTTALYYCTLKLHKDGEISIWKCYWRSFKGNFFQSTAVWLGLIGAAICVLLGKRAAESSGMPQAAAYFTWGTAILLVILALYIFPTIASFENKIGKLIPFALFFAAKKPLYMISMAAITCIPMYFTIVDAKLFPVYLLIWLMCGFSLTVYANSWFLWRLFKPYFPDEDEKPENRDNGTDQYVF